ncbi:MAG: two-component regulator propeller domain-containing protein, partial [Planctomycetota bacterium]|nr:two-component regulator propeller domain-containing protein [Planctomycetota bacterium]
MVNDMILGSKAEVVNKMPCASGTLILSLLLILGLSAPISLGDGVADTPFVQEYHEAYTVGQESASNDVRAITVDGVEGVWVGTGVGVYRLDGDTKQWVRLLGETDAGPVYDMVADSAGTVWVGAWNGMYRSTSDGLQRLEQINHPIVALCAAKDGIIGLGAGGVWRVAKDTCTFKETPYSKHFRAVLPDRHSGLWIATGMGLYHHMDTRHKFYQAESELLSPDIHDIAYASDGSLWIGGLGGITVYKEANRVRSFTPNEGLPSISIRCVRQGPEGHIWIGTDQGVARCDGRNWLLRHSKRWLVSDDVRDIAFDSQGTAW